MTIRRFTPPTERIFNLIPADVGRPLSGIRHNLVQPAVDASSKDALEPARYPLESLVSEVINMVTVSERQVQDKDGRWYGLRVRPFVTLDNKVDGAVVLLTDIDALKRSEQKFIDERDYVSWISRAGAATAGSRQ